MRFLSLVLVLSGCALVDAGGEQHGSTGLSFSQENLDMTSAGPPDALIAQLDGVAGSDVIVLSGGGGGGGILIECLQMGTSGRNFDCTMHPELGQFQAITVGDTDGDGSLEIIAASMTKVSVLRNNGNTLEEVPITVSLPAVPAQVDVVKLALSAMPVIVVSYGPSFLPTLITDPHTTPATSQLVFTGSVRHLAHGNVTTNDSGDEELVILGDGAQVSVLSGTALDRQDEPLDQGVMPSQVAIGDFAGGPGLDVAIVQGGAGPNAFLVLPGSPSGISHGNEVAFGMGTGDDLVGGDIDGDGLTDLVTLFRGMGGDRRVGIFLAAGNTMDMTRFSTDTEISVSSNPGHIRLGDLNDDGRADVLLLQDNNPGGINYLLSN